MMRKVFILGDSHAYQIELAHRRTDKLDEKAWGLELEFRTFGAVKQGVRPHHRVVGSHIELLEDNWRKRSFPASKMIQWMERHYMSSVCRSTSRRCCAPSNFHP